MMKIMLILLEGNDKVRVGDREREREREREDKLKIGRNLTVEATPFSLLYF